MCHRPATKLLQTRKFYTDGSGGKPRSSCACIQLSEAGRKKICLLLAPCDGPDAELFGGILALLMHRAGTSHSKMTSASFASSAVAFSSKTSTSVASFSKENATAEDAKDAEVFVGMCWCSDSLQSVEMGRKILSEGKEPPSPVWKIWQSFAFKGLTCEWIKSRNGQRENEACDRACNWLKTKGEVLLTQNGEGPVGMEAKRKRSESWTLIDAREFSNRAMRGEECGQEMTVLLEKIQEAVAPKLPAVASAAM